MAYDRQAAEVYGQYGRVHADEFDAMRLALKPPLFDDFYTFREDYEIYGARTGELRISYAGRCEVCGLSCEVNETKRFWPLTAAPSSGTLEL